MTELSQVDGLNQRSLAAFPDLFATLGAPELASLPGCYRGAFVGPGWLRAIAPHGLAFIHLGGWWGKEIRADCTGVNLLRRHDAVQRGFPLRITFAASVIDGSPVVAVHYPSECPFPWPHVVDELRRLDGDCILGMTLVPTGLLRRLPLPFLLIRTDRPHGL